MPVFPFPRRQGVAQPTHRQQFLRRLAHEARELFCSVCGIHPPQWTGGPCVVCEPELGAGG